MGTNTRDMWNLIWTRTTQQTTTNQCLPMGRKTTLRLMRRPAVTSPLPPMSMETISSLMRNQTVIAPLVINLYYSLDIIHTAPLYYTTHFNKFVVILSKEKKKKKKVLALIPLL